jgi:opine dehydrogenase
MIVTIIGAGNAGYAQASKLTERGHSVRLLKTSHAIHEESFKEVQRNGGIYAVDTTNNDHTFFAKLDKITRNVEEALLDANVIMVLTQTLYHESIAEMTAGYINENQLVIIIPGNSGSIFFKKNTSKKNIVFSEGESMPYDARIIENGKVRISFKNVRNALSFLPASKKDEGMKVASKLFDTYRYFRKHIFESALQNPNIVVHTIGTILSASRIEYSQGDFWMYREGFTDSIWNVVKDLDKEKNDILEALGCERLNYLDACKFRNGEDLTADSLEVFKHYAQKGGPKGPSSLNTRFLYEDIPMGLCLLSSLGKKCFIPTPISDSLITIASSLLKKDFWKEGRTLEKLGLDEMSKEEIIDYVTT